MQPSLTAVPSRKPIDLASALQSTLRSWLAARDAALWPFVMGVDGIAEEVDLDAARVAVEQMNSLLRAARWQAAQLGSNTRTADAVLTEAITALLAAESPKFLLRVDHMPGSF